MAGSDTAPHPIVTVYAFFSSSHEVPTSESVELCARALTLFGRSIVEVR